MAEYIERESLLEKAEEIEWWNETTGFYDHIRIVHAYDVEDAPATDVVEVKHGEWMKKPARFGSRYDMYGCSVCGWTYTFHPDYNYCPRCGAKMDLKEGAE